MTPALWKDLFREIRHSLGRYLSIFAITALGVAFFAGIKASAPDMKNSADAYFDKYAMQDIQVYSTVGISKDDLEAIRKLGGVETVQGQYTQDFLCRLDSRELTVKVISFTPDQSINKPRLVEGRMPENEHECLAEGESATGNIFGTFAIGDTVTLYSGTDDPISDSLKTDTFTVVGKAYSPNYLSYVHGSSSIGSGSVDTYFYIPQKDIAADYYTEADLLVAGAKDQDTYSDAYFDLTDPVVTRLEDLEDTQIKAWTDSQMAKIDEEEKKANEEFAKAQKKLDEAKKKLDDSQSQIDASSSQISSGEAQLNSSAAQLASGWNQLGLGKAQIQTGLEQINSAIASIEEAQKALPALIEQRDQVSAALAAIPSLDQGITGIQTLASGIDTLQTQIDALKAQEGQEEQIAALQAQQEALKSQLNAALAAAGVSGMDAASAISALNAQKAQILAPLGGSPESAQAMLDQLNAGITQSQEAISQLDSLQATKNNLLAQQAQLAQSEQTLSYQQGQYNQSAAELETGKQQLADAIAKADQGKTEYQNGVDELNRQKEEAKKKFEEARQKVKDLDPQWIVLDRSSHYSYRDYEACADRMDGIASVFPVFFFLVAALVCMTTMTRMVDEQRNEMGTLKALGYSRRQIAAKYLIYAGSASVLGSIVGCAIGMYVFPKIIYSAWNIMYNLEDIQFRFQPGLILLASGSVTLIVLLAALFSIIKELREVPAQLMRPKAAKAGQRILLERVGWFWSKLSFMHKVTLRNLFRYKKRFFMTVIGIAGCSALLVAGFGLNDSISDIIPRQFGLIYHYDASISADAKDSQKLCEDLKKEKGIKDAFELQTLPVTVNYDHKDVSATLNIVSDPEAFEPFMTFLPMDGSDSLSLDTDGALVSVKTAEKMNLHPGSELTFKTADDQEIHLPVTGIFEQYTGHMIYISEKTFKAADIKEKPSADILLMDDDTSPEFESELGSRILSHEGVRSVTFYSATIENFENMISSIKMIVVVLVLSAAMLAFVVLYNLANVNISERMREIATIKVLGFTEKEVNAYINRESILLACIGALAGLFLGIYLHGLIMNLAELDTIRFGRTIFWQSFAISFGLTILFALIVSWIMKFQLRKIQMVESLKAVE